MTAPTYPFGRALREGFRLAAPVLAALALGAYIASMQLDVETRQPFRLLAFLPVALAAYRRRGLLPGLAYAAGFGLLYLWEAGWAITAGGLTEQQPEAIAATLFLLAVAIVFAGIAEGRRSREALRDRAEDRRQLLDRAHSLAEVAAFVRQEAQRDTYAHDAALLLRRGDGAGGGALENGGAAGADSEGWHLLAADRTFPVPTDATGTPLSLAAWLVAQARQVVIDDLDADPRFGGRSDIRSVMSLPLWGLDGMLQGLLVLLDRRPARFSAIDLARLDALAEAAGAALTSLQRLASRLTAIERATRDLNSRLDRQAITEKGLRYARLVTAAGTSAILVTSGPEPPACEAAGRAVTPALRAILQRGAALPAASSEPADTTRGERLLAPIRRGELSLGALLVEGPQGGFEPYDVQVLATLAEHLAVALENAALLAAVRDERERAEQVIENTSDGLVVLDAGGRVVRMNRAAARLTGWAAAEATGRPVADLVPDVRLPVGGGSLSPTQDALPGTGVPSVTGERRPVLTREGVRRVLEVSVAPLPPPEEGTVLLLHDATAEEEMARFQRELVATFSHELRAPLTNMAAITELLLRAGDVRLEGRARDLAEMLREQTQRLATLSERTLDLAQLEAGERHMEPRPLPVLRVAEEALDRWHAAAGSGRLHLEPPPPNLWAWADEEAVGSVVDTLLDNALKYAGDEARVTLSVCAEGEAAVAFTVADNGPGIPPDTQARLFQRFSRGDASDSQRVYGYGLGLYAARLLVEAMGGAIRVESRPGAGSRFTFTVPRMGGPHPLPPLPHCDVGEGDIGDGIGRSTTNDRTEGEG